MRTLPETDTDRIIASQEAQAHKTRVLLVWLLVGIPVLAGLVWGGLAVASLHGSNGPDSTASNTCSVDDQVVVDLARCPLSGPRLSDGTMCSTFNHWYNGVAVDPAKTNPAEYFMYQHDVGDVVDFGDRCVQDPHATLGSILAAEGLPQETSSDGVTGVGLGY